MLTIQFKDRSEQLREEDIEVDEQSVENEIFSKYVPEEIEIDGTEEQQANDEIRDEATTQGKISYSGH
ncbi:41626_t:CDS:2 [Gigaspora margarita]|uniref:41626_t:CDS:1 n=1 Tax=Gigaspora margarita TaxID=4874 RepID=A0ABN7UIA1_GIGMA|nr:41626_t:CDS:2 [Gigaspora margarita]